MGAKSQHGVSREPRIQNNTFFVNFLVLVYRNLGLGAVAET